MLDRLATTVHDSRAPATKAGDYTPGVRRIPLIIVPDADDPDFAAVMVDATVAGHPYRLMLDTGAARTQLPADDYTSTLPIAGADTSSGSFGSAQTDAIVTITDLVVGPLRVPSLDVTRTERGISQVLGMDVLGRYCCHFQLEAAVMDVEAPDRFVFDNTLVIGPRGHVYVDACWPGVSARACWDTGAGATVVDRTFWLSHPDLFEQIGVTVGTDSGGGSARSPLLLMTGPVIGERTFSRHKAVAVDLSPVNRAVDIPMDMILGYPTIRQADWLFDFPARRWTLTGGLPALTRPGSRAMSRVPSRPPPPSTSRTTTPARTSQSRPARPRGRSCSASRSGRAGATERACLAHAPRRSTQHRPRELAAAR